MKKKKKLTVLPHKHIWEVFTEEDYWVCMCPDVCTCIRPSYAVARCTVKGCQEKMDAHEIEDVLNR